MCFIIIIIIIIIDIKFKLGITHFAQLHGNLM